MKRLLHRYNDLGMIAKLFLTYFCLIAIPFVLFFSIINYVMSDELESQALYSSRQNFEQELYFLEYKIESIRTYMNVISMNEKVQEIIKKDPSVYQSNYGLWGFDLQEVRRQYFNSGRTSDIAAITMYLRNSLPVISETDDFFDISKAEDTAWYTKLMTENETFQWAVESDLIHTSEGRDSGISAFRKIPNSDNIREIIGVLRVDIPEATVKDMLGRASPFQSSMAFLLDKEGRLISKSSTTPQTDTAFVAATLSQATQQQMEEGVWEKARLDSGDYIVGAQLVDGTDWTMVIAVPYDEIFAAKNRSLQQILIVFLLLIPLMLPLAYLGAYSGTRRIRRLTSSMRKIQQGHTTLDALPESKDEIGELTKNFNSMQARITNLMEEQYQLGQENKTLEMNALQTQINPHFLYNTLDLIYWRALRIGDEGIQNLTLSLSRFYKLSLSNGKDIVTLENEIAHVKTYVDIQNARFNNTIKLEVDVPPGILALRLPKITLQPLVENAILHGIMETPSESGTIRITGEQQEDAATIHLTDDGAGMPAGILEHIMDDRVDRNHPGYGVYNINKRIQLLYGSAYGLSFSSIPSKGTVVTIQIPVQPDL